MKKLKEYAINTSTLCANLCFMGIVISWFGITTGFKKVTSWVK